MSAPSSYMLATTKSCPPKTKTGTKAPQTSGGKTYTESDHRNCDAVTQKKIWAETVQSETRCRKNWESNWGFLADYDAKGNLKEKEEMPDRVALYSENVPNTNAANYGHRITSELGQKMQAMEFKFYGEKRRKKMGGDLICY